MKPLLNKTITIDEFCSYYWLKAELQQFCRENDMSTAGAKNEIAERIAIFLQTGEKQKPTSKMRPTSPKIISTDLSLDTIITENHRCSQSVRAFFKSEIPTFHFSTYIQNYFKENIGKTYRDVVNAWYKEEEEQKKDLLYKKEIRSQFEYNQFTRDFFADPKNKGKNREEAIQAWNKIKKLPGSNKYIPEH